MIKPKRFKTEKILREEFTPELFKKKAGMAHRARKLRNVIIHAVRAQTSGEDFGE